jgi:hypothetical protein
VIKNAYKILDGKPEGNRTLGRPRRRWKDNIRMYLREIGKRRGTGWIGCIWLRVGASSRVL